MSKTAEQPRHFLEVADLSPKELHWVLEKALKIRKRVDDNRLKTRDELHGRSIAFLTSKESLRTRGSIHQAASLLGGEAVTFGKDSLYDEKSQPREPVG
jgi:ornithine carbamoyltransferase